MPRSTAPPAAPTASPASPRNARSARAQWREEILNLIEEDEDIAILILAASTGTEGPGPLVSSLYKNIGQYPVPVGIVPGNLTDEELDALS